ncbi:hypothetical protein KSP39_PZI010116 [Platanthera zijinensis]|uniref:Uncharacterized protein n=1 Tax=Platanthera zijinensis TaxID=2320716 RepID=A0AAP0G6W9_9ASPA
MTCCRSCMVGIVEDEQHKLKGGQGAGWWWPADGGGQSGGRLAARGRRSRAAARIGKSKEGRSYLYPTPWRLGDFLEELARAERVSLLVAYLASFQSSHTISNADEKLLQESIVALYVYLGIAKPKRPREEDVVAELPTPKRKKTKRPKKTMASKVSDPPPPSEQVVASTSNAARSASTQKLLSNLDRPATPGATFIDVIGLSGSEYRHATARAYLELESKFDQLAICEPHRWISTLEVRVARIEELRTTLESYEARFHMVKENDHQLAINNHCLQLILDELAGMRASMGSAGRCQSSPPLNKSRCLQPTCYSTEWENQCPRVARTREHDQTEVPTWKEYDNDNEEVYDWCEIGIFSLSRFAFLNPKAKPAHPRSSPDTIFLLSLPLLGAALSLIHLQATELQEGAKVPQSVHLHPILEVALCPASKKGRLSTLQPILTPILPTETALLQILDVPMFSTYVSQDFNSSFPLMRISGREHDPRGKTMAEIKVNILDYLVCDPVTDEDEEYITSVAYLLGVGVIRPELFVERARPRWECARLRCTRYAGALVLTRMATRVPACVAQFPGGGACTRFCPLLGCQLWLASSAIQGAQLQLWFGRGNTLRSSGSVVGPPRCSLGSVFSSKSTAKQSSLEEVSASCPLSGQGTNHDDSPPPVSPSTVRMFKDFNREILETIHHAFSARAECSTPADLAVTPPFLGEIAPGWRPGKEVAGEGFERDLVGRELFPSPTGLGPTNELIIRAKQARPASVRSPLCQLIVSALVLEGFKEPELTCYTGKDDPVQHLQWLEDVVSIGQMSDALKCRIFSITLRDKAKDLFH